MHFGLIILEFVASKEIETVRSRAINFCLVHKVVTTLVLTCCIYLVNVSVHTVDSNKAFIFLSSELVQSNNTKEIALLLR